MRDSLKIFCSQVFWNALSIVCIIVAVAVFLAAWLYENSEVAW